MSNNNPFFSQGSYGCVRFPPIECDTVNISKKNTISKISIRDFFSENELFVGKYIHKIILKENLESSQLFVYYFKKCNVIKKKLNSYKIFSKKCKLLKKENNFTILYGPYISNSQTLSSYFNVNFSWEKIFYFYFFSLKISKILYKYKIIHNDISFKNIIVSNNSTFHLIDFGMTIIINKALNKDKTLNYDYLYNFLIYSPSFLYWSIEHHILCYYINYKKQLTIEKLLEIISTAYDNNPVYRQFKNIKIYKKTVFEYYKKIILLEKSVHVHIRDLFLSSYKTWDMYTLCYICLKSIYDNNLHLDSKYNDFIDLLQKGIHYNYNKRPSIKKCIIKFVNILHKMNN